MQKKIILAIAFIIIFLINTGFSQEECPATTAEAAEYSMTIEINEDQTTILTLDVTIPYPLKCLNQPGKDLRALLDGKADCAAATINDAIYSNIGSFIQQSKCAMSYDKIQKKLIITTQSISEKLIKAEGQDTYLLTFDKWNLKESKKEAKTNLAIVLPRTGQLISYFPQQKSEYSKSENKVIWNEIPSTLIRVKYSQPNPIALILTIAIPLAIIFGGYFILKKNKKSKLHIELDNLLLEEKKIQKSLKELNYSYLKRQVDEQSYRHMNEQYTMKLTEIQIRKREIEEEKQKKIEEKKNKAIEMQEMKVPETTQKQENMQSEQEAQQETKQTQTQQEQKKEEAKEEQPKQE